MPYSELEVKEYARKIGKSRSTIWSWIKQGCDLRNPKSVAEWVTRNQIRETPIERARKRRRDEQIRVAAEAAKSPQERSEPATKGEPLPEGKKGAAAALERL